MLQHFMETVAAKVVADDHQYMKCTIVADYERFWKKEVKGYEHTHWGNSLFRPRPHDQPNLVCEAARFYVENRGQSRETRSSFIAAGSNPDAELTRFKRFGFTVKSLLQRAWDLYEQYHNEGSLQATDIGTIDFNTGGFDMPVCFHEQQYLKDFQYYSSWKFPMVCGDHTGNETATFLRKEGLFPRAVDPSQISTDRVVRVNSCFLHLTYIQADSLYRRPSTTPRLSPLS
jgi:hypothetical protein